MSNAEDSQESNCELQVQPTKVRYLSDDRITSFQASLRRGSELWKGISSITETISDRADATVYAADDRFVTRCPCGRRLTYKQVALLRLEGAAG
jgi:hypothetical protein